MAPVQIRLILSVFGVLLCGALINVHFFQTDVRARKAGLKAGNRAVIAAVDPKASTGYRGDGARWQSRLRRDGRIAETTVEERSQITETVKAPHKTDAAVQRPRAMVRVTPKVGNRPAIDIEQRRKVAATIQKPPRINKLVRAVQRELTSRGYEPGPVDGIEGLMTRAAIMAYQHDGGHSLSGRSSEGLLRQLVLGGGSLLTADTVSDRGVKTRRDVTKTVQLRLKRLGYSSVSANGFMSKTTRDAIKGFEKYSGLVPTGRISGRLIGKLSNTPKLRFGARM